MRKVQKIIIIVTLIAVFMAVVFPPCFIIGQTGAGKGIKLNYLSWEMILGVGTTFGTYNRYTRIRFDVLGLEILAILILGSIALVVTVKKRS